MKKSIISLSVIASLSMSSFANDINEEMYKQIQALKAQIEALEKKLETKQSQAQTIDEKRISKIEKKLDSVSRTATTAKIQSAQDNLKWDVDFRTQYDSVQYKMSNGQKLKNESLLSNRLWLGMKYKADENSSFFGTLSYNKLFGENEQAVGNSQNDFITNEAATNDNSIKLKEAYWLYSNDTFLGTDVPWTVSVGRRPSTDGLGINLRIDEQAKSPLSHTVNVEFDGASAKFDLEKVIGLTGSWIKICAGRGLSDAKLRFDSTGTDYSKSEKADNMDMLGFIAVPYDDGQYSIHTNYARAWNLVGYKTPTDTSFSTFGDMDLATIMLKTQGIGNGISDYLDDTVAFASFAMSKTHPNENGMLGSMDSETGNSVWLGINAPCPLTPDSARIGVEWNKGSKYWRSFTYAEDSMIGSKIAARGTAWEIYRNQQLTKALSSSIRFTQINYDYAGSNGFMGNLGNPNYSGNYVKEAQNITAYIKYKF